MAAGNLEQEYQQVRTIALRDSKVRAAYDDADRRLEAKIVQIDPALASYAATRTHGGAVAGQPVAPAHVAPAAKAPATRGGFVPQESHGVTHTVTKGETLGGIAAQYGVSAATLKMANHIQDERKLPVGQVLTIPGARKVTPAKAAPEKKEKSWWDRISS
jgi:nucleoid-associated protein YgaU